MSLAQRSKPLNLVGPAPLLKWLRVTSELLRIGLTFQVNFRPVRPGLVAKTTGFVVKAARATHSVEAYAYLVEEKTRPGVFYPQRAKRLGVPEGSLWSRLQKGRSVTVGGRTVTPSQVTGPPRPGRKVGYSGDTRPSQRLVRLFSGCDLLILDSTFRGSDRDKAVERMHSTSLEAAELALRAKARRLVLTHFSARYRNVSPLVREARGIFPDTVAASDGLSVRVDYPAG
jgi:ribonuclease Z